MTGLSWKRFVKYPFYSLDDLEYQRFILMLLEYLEPRFLKAF